MKRVLLLAALLTLTLLGSCQQTNSSERYIVLTSKAVQEDAEWNAVANSLATKHSAEVILFDTSPTELVAQLRELNPRYVAIVDRPENIGRDYVIDFHLASRTIDDDIYADFFWGIITGYDAKAAQRMVDNSAEPLVVKSAVATIMELNSARWFDNYAWVDDHTRGLWGMKRGRDSEIITAKVEPWQVLRKFTDIYADIDPDLIVTAAHATQRNLEMPYSLGNLKPRDGKLYADDKFTRKEWDLTESGKRRVYAAVGNCLIGDMNNTKESMAAAWLSGSNAATMLGYVVTTWHGRNGWGALKYWVANPERYTLAQAVYINQQDLLHQQHAWYPELITERYNFCEGFDEELMCAAERISEVVGRKLDLNNAQDWDMMGFWHDRDVLAYYGDPKWEVRLQSAGEQDYTVTSKRRGKELTVTITTGENFDMEKLRGFKFKQEHVLDLPFSYIFPERLDSPELAEGQQWNVALDENFLLVYDAEFQPSSTYEIVIKTR